MFDNCQVTEMVDSWLIKSSNINFYIAKHIELEVN